MPPSTPHPDPRPGPPRQRPEGEPGNSWSRRDSGGPRPAGRLRRASGAPVALFRGVLLCGALWACGGGEEAALEPIAADEMPPGFWFDTRFAPGAGDLSPEERAHLESLGALGYATGYEEAPVERGVVVHDPERSEGGWNLFSSGHAPEAFLTDMEGEVLHRWHHAYGDLPGAPPLEHPTQDAWRRVRLLPDGGLLAIHDGLCLVRLDRDSNLLWVHAGNEHHDLFVRPEDGHVFTLTRRPRRHPRLPGAEPVLEDHVLELDADGAPVREVSLVDALLDSPFRGELLEVAAPGGDVLHTNSIAPVTAALAARQSRTRVGEVLVCFRELDAVATVDLEHGRVTSFLRADWEALHDPRPLPDGTLLLFDNMGWRGHSRVVQADPVSGERLWQYAGDPPEALFSVFCGAAQRLPGGNTLITETCRGRALEVTPEGEEVWRFASPHRAGEQQRLVAALYEVTRLLERPAWLPEPGAGR